MRLGTAACLLLPVQAPLQPLQDNLELQTYETFEKDLTKYAQYEEAVLAALRDRVPEAEAGTRESVLMVRGCACTMLLCARGGPGGCALGVHFCFSMAVAHWLLRIDSMGCLIMYAHSDLGGLFSCMFTHYLYWQPKEKWQLHHMDPMPLIAAC